MRFLSTPSARRATHELDHGQRAQVISIHALCEEGDPENVVISKMPEISIHALCEEGDEIPRNLMNRGHNFYPRPLRGGRLVVRHILVPSFLFLSTPSARRATFELVSTSLVEIISIHALCEEGDPLMSTYRPSSFNFYPRPLRGGRRCKAYGQFPRSLFLSTPSARRATRGGTRYREVLRISIHALREEGDATGETGWRASSNFYPRPPRGGRPRCRSLHPVRSGISIHALREEGDPAPHAAAGYCRYFYPRPPRGGRLRLLGRSLRSF